MTRRWAISLPTTPPSRDPEQGRSNSGRGLLARAAHRQALTLFPHGSRSATIAARRRMSANCSKPPGCSGPQPIDDSLARSLVTLGKHETLAGWFATLPSHASDAAAGKRFASGAFVPGIGLEKLPAAEQERRRRQAPVRTPRQGQRAGLVHLCAHRPPIVRGELLENDLLAGHR